MKTSLCIGIITPTFRRSVSILERCLLSIDQQTYPHWKHMVIVDDSDLHPHIAKQTQTRFSRGPQRQFSCLGYHSSNYGNDPRQHAIFHLFFQECDFLVFIDDDNIVFPHYLETFVHAIQSNPSIQFWIVSILHCGPLPYETGIPPMVLKGNPIRVGHIDTLQVCIHRHSLMIHGGWNCHAGYTADGTTFERLSHLVSVSWISDSIQGIHL